MGQKYTIMRKNRKKTYKLTKEMLALAMNQLKEREGGRLINE